MDNEQYFRKLTKSRFHWAIDERPKWKKPNAPICSAWPRLGSCEDFLKRSRFRPMKGQSGGLYEKKTDLPDHWICDKSWRLEKNVVIIKIKIYLKAYFKVV